ncbi:hypothetical protein ACLOAV_004864 [Pseudogymnoascus australis]
MVDYLNLELGIMHQDITPRNLLVDPEADNLLLFDIDRAARIGQPSYFTERNDVKGVVFTLYEIISRDDHLWNTESMIKSQLWPLRAGPSEPNWTLMLESFESS